MSMRVRVALAALLLAPCPAWATDAPIVVELFTSQGCSSCPPADALLTDLARDRPDILPLSLHVTYWNSLGWRDTYSLDEATERQRLYAAARGDGEVFTPELVVDGRTSVIGSDRDAVVAALAGATHPAAPQIALTRAGDGLRVEIGPGQGHGRLELIGYDPRHVTAIGRGENAGRSLVETNIVRAVIPLGAWRGVALSLAAQPPEGERVAVLLRSEDGAILSAARL